MNYILCGKWVRPCLGYQQITADTVLYTGAAFFNNLIADSPVHHPTTLHSLTNVHSFVGCEVGKEGEAKEEQCSSWGGWSCAWRGGGGRRRRLGGEPPVATIRSGA